MHTIWQEVKVVAHWKNAEVVPIRKKGDLQHCDNWSGISLGGGKTRNALGDCREDTTRVPVWVVI